MAKDKGKKQKQETLNEASEIYAKDIHWPFEVKDKIVVIGGHDSWAKVIKPMFKGKIRFVDRNSTPDIQQLRNASAVWIQTNAMSHRAYYKTSNITKKEQIPLYYFTSASAEKCAMQIVKSVS